MIFYKLQAYKQGPIHKYNFSCKKHFADFEHSDWLLNCFQKIRELKANIVSFNKGNFVFMIGPGFKRWIYLLIQSRLDSNFRWINLAYIIFHFEYILGLFWVMHFSIKDEGKHTRMLETFVTIFFLSLLSQMTGVNIT